MVASSFEQAANAGHITDAEKLASIQSLLQGVDHRQGVGLLLCMTVLAGSLLSFSTADEAAGLPPFPDGYDRESEELIEFPAPYQAFAVREYTLPEMSFPMFLGGVPGLISGAVCARVFYGRQQTTLAATA